jgi:hypothetical protein
MTKEDWIQLYEFQKGYCPICLRKLKNRFDESSQGEKARVDHDHKFNQVRGLTCHPCNLMLQEHISKEVLERIEVFIDHPPAVRCLGVRKCRPNGK